MSSILSPDSALNTTLSFLAEESLWAYLVIAALVFCGIYFSARTRFVQFRMIREMFRLLVDSSPGTSSDKKQISSFQAFAVSVATRVGTGNIVGVATAITIGGPGAVFWMWVMAIVGAASAFVESTLAQLFKRRASDAFIGGPAYYILHGMHKPWMAGLFAVLITITFGLSFNSIQGNAICQAMNDAFGFDSLTVGLITAAVGLVIVFGGIQRIAKVSSILVPIMAVGYFILALVIIVMNYSEIPHVFKIIVESAFGFGQFAGGAVGMTIMMGIRRGLFSNEAGEGSAPNAAATADVTHPVKQGLVQSLGVFTDTLLVCSCTAFIILISGIYTNPSAEAGTLTQDAINATIGSAGEIFVAIAILFFAFSSIIGNYYYGETNIRFLTQRRWILTVFRIFSAGVFVVFGAVASLDVVWNLGDLFMGMLTICNLVAILWLGKYAFRLLNDYCAQKRRGITDPTFHASQMPEIYDDLDAWKDEDK